MEFENNQPTDDEQRRLIEAKKVTIQPLHTDITPDAIPDAEIAAQNRAQETAPTAINDTEDTSLSQLIQPTKSALNKATDGAPSTRTRNARPTTRTVVALFLIILIGATIWLWMHAA